MRGFALLLTLDLQVCTKMIDCIEMHMKAQGGEKKGKCGRHLQRKLNSQVSLGC